MWYNHQYSHHSMAFPLDIWGSSLFQKVNILSRLCKLNFNMLDYN